MYYFVMTMMVWGIVSFILNFVLLVVQHEADRRNTAINALITLSYTLWATWLILTYEAVK